MKIVVTRNDLLVVRRQARQAFPNEFMACLWGLRTESEIIIRQFRAIPHTGTDFSAIYDPADVRRSKQAALRAGLEFVGTIHSHPYESQSQIITCEHLSPDDLKTSAVNGEVISAVIYVYNHGRSTQVFWYEPSLPPEIIYA